MRTYTYMDMILKPTGKTWMIWTPYGQLFGSAPSVNSARRMIKTDRLLKEKELRCS